MSTSIVKKPQYLSPVYNEMIVVLDSTNKTQSNFQFVCTLKQGSTTLSVIKIPVNPSGYGILDVHRHLMNQVTFDFDPTVVKGWTRATNSRISYDIELAEEYRYSWDFYDNFFLSGGKIGFLNATTEPLFSVNDEIIIIQDAGFTNADYNGLTTVTGVTFSVSESAWVLETNKDWTGNTPADGGTVYLANYELSTYAQTFSITDYEAFNGVYSYQDYITYDWDDLDANSASNGQFLTNVPNNYSMFTTDKMWLNVYSATNNAIYNLVITTDNGTYRIRNTFTNPSTKNNRLLQIGCGAGNLSQYEAADIISYTGTLPIIDENSTYFTLSVENLNNDQTIASKTFNIRTDCSKYEKVQLIFMDKLGSFIPFTFNMVNKHNKNIERVNFQQSYGQYAPASNNWSYNTWDRGMRSLDTVVSEEYTVNSNWVNQATSDYLMELYESPECYWINEAGLVQAINITSTSTERKQVLNDQIINYTLTFMLSNKNKTQKG